MKHLNAVLLPEAVVFFDDARYIVCIGLSKSKLRCAIDIAFVL
jgi:hypothetical protein